DFLADEAKRYPGFRLVMQTDATDVVRAGDRITGVVAAAPDGDMEVRADVIVAADGRHSTIRDATKLDVKEYGAPMDVLWMRLSRRERDPPQTFGRFDAGRIFIMLDRGDYWQCAFVVPKNGFDKLRQEGLAEFRAEIARLAPHLQGRVNELASWDDVKLLTVAVNRMPRWHLPGLLFIGDAAHAMSPIGGVGINLAVQDAVAAANRLVPRLRSGEATEDDLKAIQRRREWPTRVTQRMQILAQNRIISNVLRSTQTPALPWAIRLLGRYPVLQRLPARIIGMGIRPEHIRH
ncbi:MAG: FAD-dependent oxidoreductase, partial [Acetobacteraceae bacterium]|nr:FAD-dependent oxidoreductase [Acetobacteraceae bacterium]